MNFPAIQTTSDLAAYAAVASALIALLAVIIGPILTLWISMRQLQGTVLSSNRQKWIDELRHEIAGVLNCLSALQIHFAERRDPEPLIEILQKYTWHAAKITLLINPNEQDHLRLQHLVIKTFQHIPNTPEESELIDKGTKEIINLSQVILKREWARVKRLK